jgi:hypothetical protein
VCAVVTCCDHDEEQEVPVGPQIAGQDCSCLHSPLESAPQNLRKSLAADVLSPWHNMWLAPTELNAVARMRALEEASLSASGGLRPHESPQLAVLATVVLRV